MQTNKLEAIQEYWNNYYHSKKAPSTPSTFALFCKENFIKDSHRILELGCGNARDSFYFAKTNDVIGIDASAEVIAQNRQLKDEQNISKVQFYDGFFGKDMHSLANTKIDVIYSRFVLHAMTEELENEVLSNSWEILEPGGMFMSEFRTIRDPLMQQGTTISENEKLTDHYRRFINLEIIKEKLRAIDFKIIFETESAGLAKFKDDDPVVARIIAVR